MIKFAIFDIGQVCYPYSLNMLNKFMQANTKNLQNFLKNNGIKSFNYKPFMRGEIKFEQFCEDLCNYCDVVYFPDINAKINNAMHKGVGNFFPETLKVMEKLRHNKIKVCLLSNALPNLADTAQDLTAKELIFTSYELGMLKPDVQCYQTVLQKLNAKPQEVVFIDDKPTNVEAAQSISIHGIVFERNTIEQDVAKTINNSQYQIQKSAFKNSQDY